MSEHSPKTPNLKAGLDVYTDPKEILWKFVSLEAYDSIIQKLGIAGILSDPEIHKLHIATIDLFNSNHNHKIYCGRTKLILERLRQQLSTMGHSKIYDAIEADVKIAAHQVTNLVEKIDMQALHVSPEQTSINDGAIRIAGMSIEDFSSQEDYFAATLQLFNERDEKYRNVIERAFLDGFELDTYEKNLVLQAKYSGTQMIDLLTSQLLREQMSGKYPDLTAYEYRPLGSSEDNDVRRSKVLSEAYFLIGKIMRIIAEFCKEDQLQEIEEDIINDPVSKFLSATGKKLTSLQISTVKKIALAHVSHGLNSGELTARLAGSVRTSFPRALIASFNIRSGILHSGAITECMRQTNDYLRSNSAPEAYVDRLLKTEKPYGFGHRIHKTNNDDPIDVLGKDPRVELYIRACREGFPEKNAQIDRLVEYATAIRKLRPSLGANTDFGASVLFNLLELSANTAMGFFTFFRSPGVCAQIVNELDVKGNSRRPPFPPVLPYPRK